MGPCFRRDDESKAVIASASEAIQKLIGELDCFALRNDAYSIETRFHLLAARCVRAMKGEALEKSEGAGLPKEGSRESRVPVAPAAARGE